MNVSLQQRLVVDLNRALPRAFVRVVEYQYAVDFGASVRPRLHYVGKDRRCNCGLGADCPAIIAVSDYIKAGGVRAPEPPPGFMATLPEKCPICGQGVYHEPRLGSSKRGIGWACTSSGDKCYHRWMVESWKQLLAANPDPWHFRPVVERAGKIQKVEQVAEGDKVLYPGLRVSEIL